MRTFIAVDLPAEVKARISDLVHRLKFAAPGGIGWAKVSDIHVTLKFLGEIEEAALASVERVVGEAASETPVFPLSVFGTGTFPPCSSRPRVLWIGLKESQALLDLQSRIEKRLETHGHPREDRPFRPHLTIGRVKSPAVPKILLDRLAEYEEVSFGDLTVLEVAVYRSVLRPQGPEHSVLFKGALRA